MCSFTTTASRLAPRRQGATDVMRPECGMDCRKSCDQGRPIEDDPVDLTCVERLTVSTSRLRVRGDDGRVPRRLGVPFQLEVGRFQPKNVTVTSWQGRFIVIFWWLFVAFIFHFSCFCCCLLLFFSSLLPSCSASSPSFLLGGGCWWCWSW